MNGKILSYSVFFQNIQYLLVEQYINISGYIKLNYFYNIFHFDYYIGIYYHLQHSLILHSLLNIDKEYVKYINFTNQFFVTLSSNVSRMMQMALVFSKT